MPSITFSSTKPLRVLHLYAGGGGREIGTTPGLLTFSIDAADSWIVLDNGLTDADMAQLAQDLSTYGVPELGLNHGSLTPNALLDLAGAVHLRRLALYGAWTSGDLIHLGALTQLTRLSLDSTAVDDGVFVHLAPLTGLEDLDVSRTAVTGATLQELSGLSQLRQLLALKSQFGDIGCAQLGHVPSVRFLHLLGTPITNAGIGHIAAEIPDLLDLFVDRTSVDDGAVPALQSMSRLRTLSLEATGLSNAALAALMSLPELIHFDVKRRPVDDATAQAIITSRTTWQTLYFENDTMTNAGATGLGALPDLVTLALRCKTMTNAVTSELSTALALVDLDLAGTQLGNAALPALYPLKNLRVLNVEETGQPIDQAAVDLLISEIPGLEVFF